MKKLTSNEQNQCLEKIKKKFAEEQSIIKKCCSYKEITPNLLLDAYSLAKRIHEKYEFKLTGEQEIKSALEELGVKLHIESSNENSCITVTLENEINFYIRYHVERFRCPTREMGDKIFCYFYALSILILYCDRFKTYKEFKFNYAKDIDEKMDENIAIKVALFMLYIKYDYDFRKKVYVHNMSKNSELPNVHPSFVNKYELNCMREFIYTGKVSKISSKKYAEAEAKRYTGHLKDALNIKILDDILNNVKILETNFSEEYKELSKMIAPVIVYKDYNNFGKSRKISF